MAHSRAKPKASKGRQPQDQKKRGRGRPTNYRDTFAEQAAKLCKLGATDVDIADFFGVTTRTIERWKSEREEFCRAITMGKDIADDRVERSLYHRAVGYEQEAVKIFMPANASEPVYATYREKINPDVAACIFWLKNRRKDQWRDRQDHTHTGKIDTNLDEVRDTLQGKLSRIAAAAAKASVSGKPQ